MKNVNLKKIIISIIAMIFFVLMNICIFFCLEQYSINEIIGIIAIYAIYSSLFCFVILHFYRDNSKRIYKIVSFVVSAICCIMHCMYEYLAKNFYYSHEPLIILAIILYLFVWVKLNWLRNIEKIITKVENTDKKSRIKRNVLISIFDLLIENPIAVYIVGFIVLVIIFDIITNHYSIVSIIEKDGIPFLTILGVIIIISIVQLAIVFALNAFAKNKKVIYVVIGVMCAIILFVPSDFKTELFGYDLNLITIVKNGVINKINDKIAEIKSKQEIDGQYKDGITKYLSIFDLVEDIHNANAGQVVKFGKSFLKSNISNKEDAYYYVLEKNENILTLISLYCIDVIDNNYIYKNGNKGYYDYLDNEFYNNAFDSNEKNMIVDIVAVDKTKHKVFIPSTKDVFLMDNNTSTNPVKGVVNNTLYNELKKHIAIFNDYYLRGVCEYIIEPHILKPKTIRTRFLIEDGIKRIFDYDETKQLDYHGVMSIFLRTKIMVDISK